MNNKLLEKLDLLERKIQKLITVNFELTQKNSNFEKKLKAKEKELQDVILQMEQLKSDYRKLQIAQSFVTGTNKNNNEAKKKISQLINEINICITELKN